MCNGEIYFSTTISTNNIIYVPPKPTINQPSKEIGKRQVHNLAKIQRKVSNTVRTRDDESKGIDLKILHYCNKFRRETPVGYLVEVTDIHFSEDPNKNASKRARAAQRRDKFHRKTNKILNIRSGHLTRAKGASLARS
jgi:hypothetical protein